MRGRVLSVPKKRTYLGADIDLAVDRVHGGLNENVGNKESNVGLGGGICDGCSNVLGERGGLLLALGVQLPVSTDERLASHIQNGRGRRSGDQGRRKGRDRRQEGCCDSKELHFGYSKDRLQRISIVKGCEAAIARMISDR